MGITWRLVASAYEGKPVARLPFVPFSLFAKMFQAGLKGMFLYSVVIDFCIKTWDSGIY